MIKLIDNKYKINNFEPDPNNFSSITIIVCYLGTVVVYGIKNNKMPKTRKIYVSVRTTFTQIFNYWHEKKV